MIMKAPLPTTLTSAISAIKWHLFPNATPMYYESLTTLSQLRQQRQRTSNSMEHIVNNLDDTIDILVQNSIHNNQKNEFQSTATTAESNTKHYIITSIALLCIGHGLLDEAHDLITPLSWTEDTHFGGPSLCSSISTSCSTSSSTTSSSTQLEIHPNIISLASYVHSLVHRREGYAIGEFGMLGWQNANYWSSVAKSRDSDYNFLPYGEIQSQILNLVTNEFHGSGVGAGVGSGVGSGSGGDEKVRSWCKEHIIDNNEWDPRALHALCASMSKDDKHNNSEDTNNNHSSEDDDNNAALKRFAERAAEVELRTLLQFSLEKAGYDCSCFGESASKTSISGSTTYTLSKEIQVDEMVAQAIANKISSAHFGAFQSNGIVTIRNLFRGAGTDGVSESYAFSVAAGLACRLLNAPACIYQNNPSSMPLEETTSTEKVYIILKNNESESSFFENLLQEQSFCYGGGPLSIGDAIAITVNDSNFLNDFKTINNSDQNNNGLYTFIPCSNSDEVASTFKDKFHNARGESPTTVVQWSKGTIFESDTIKSRRTESS